MTSVSASPRTGNAQFSAILRIDAELACKFEMNLVDERMIASCLARARRLKIEDPVYWLLLARLAEASLVCAGNYADNCECRAAGDFLVNPRQVLIYTKTSADPIVKKRHGRISRQLGVEEGRRRHWMSRFSANMFLRVTKPPLLPYLTQALRVSGRVSAVYIGRLEEGQKRIADTLAFLAAWQVSDAAVLRRRLQSVSEEERSFAESHLCRFGTRVFRQIGTSLYQCLSVPGAGSPFLAESD